MLLLALARSGPQHPLWGAQDLRETPVPGEAPRGDDIG